MLLGYMDEMFTVLLKNDSLKHSVIPDDSLEQTFEQYICARDEQYCSRISVAQDGELVGCCECSNEALVL
jgi:hypothetical protein